MSKRERRLKAIAAVVGGRVSDCGNGVLWWCRKHCESAGDPPCVVTNETLRLGYLDGHDWRVLKPQIESRLWLLYPARGAA